MSDAFQLPGYEILGKIGEGGMSTVWRARQISLDRVVAIKTLSPQYLPDAEARQRFQHEARAAARLSHPGIAQVFDAGVTEDIPFIVMEYVDGKSLGELLAAEGKLPEAKALQLVESVAQALGYAWQKDCIIHCDIKPDNLLISKMGEVKIVDLGLARFIGLHRRTTPGDAIVGTPNYTAPEQAEGVPDLDCRADIYSLGATLYHMITGVLPFSGSPGSSAMDRHIHEFLADPMEVEPTTSAPIGWLIEKMMVKNRAFRPLFWTTVLEDIAEVRSGRMPKPPMPEPGQSTVQRSQRRIEAKPVITVTKPARKRVLRTAGVASSAMTPAPVVVEQPKSDLRRALGPFFALLGIAVAVYLFLFLGLGVRSSDESAEEVTEESATAIPSGFSLHGETAAPAAAPAAVPAVAARDATPTPRRAIPANRLVLPRDVETELDDPVLIDETTPALSHASVVADASRLDLAPEWANKPSVPAPAWQELEALLRPYARLSTSSSGETTELPLVGQLTYRMLAADAAQALGTQLGEEQPVLSSAFPKDSFDFYPLRGDFGSGFNMALLIVDGNDRVAAIQLMRHAPGNAALSASDYDQAWRMFDFVQNIGTGSGARRVAHRVSSRDEVILVESEVEETSEEGETHVVARASLYLPQPLVNLILVRLESSN